MREKNIIPDKVFTGRKHELKLLESIGSQETASLVHCIWQASCWKN